MLGRLGDKMKNARVRLIKKKGGFSEGERVLLESIYLDALDVIVLAELEDEDAMLKKCREIMHNEKYNYDMRLRAAVVYTGDIIEEKELL